jgi:hypothetical protein
MREGESKNRLMKKYLASPSEKKPRGRPGTNRRYLLLRANQLRVQLSHAWPTLGAQLLAARSPEEITTAFKECAESISANLVPHHSELILEILRERKFPRERSKSQIHFLADSLGFVGSDRSVKPRRSREICAEERSKVPHVIVRCDFYITCTCGYEGPALHGACLKCGTTVKSGKLIEQEEHQR